MLEPGKILDERYEIVKHIGDGGMGSVFLANEIGLSREVAIKVSKLEMDDEEGRARFLREGKILSALAHDHILMFYRFGFTDENNPYFAMEYLTGTSLQSIVDKEGRIPWQRSLKILIQVCDAMESAHSHGIVHRDLKPSNTMLLDTPEPDYVKILDFGLARNVSGSGEASQNLTKTGVLLGSVPYMSPEQCLGAKIDHRSDIYSLACMAYEMISGDLPLSADANIGIMMKHLNEHPVTLSQKLKGAALPPKLDEVLFKAMAKNPDQRYQSMLEFKQELELILAGRSGEVRAKGVPLASSRRRQLIAAAGAGLLIVLAFASFMFYLRSAPKRMTPFLEAHATVSPKRALGLKASRNKIEMLDEAQKMDYCKQVADEILAGQAIQLNDDVVFVFKELNRLFIAQKRWLEALDYLQKCVNRFQRGPKQHLAVVQLELAKDHLTLKNLPNAEKIYRQVIGEISSDSDQSIRQTAHSELGVCLKEQKKYSEAIKEFEWVLNNLGQEQLEFKTNTQVSLADANARAGNKKEAIEILASVQSKLKNTESADALGLMRSVYGDYRILGESRQVLAQMSDAIQTLKTNNRNDEMLVTILLDRADYLSSLKQFALAEASYNQVEDVLKKDVSKHISEHEGYLLRAYFGLEESLSRQGKSDEAAAQKNYALRLLSKVDAAKRIFHLKELCRYFKVTSQPELLKESAAFALDCIDDPQCDIKTEEKNQFINEIVSYLVALDLAADASNFSKKNLQTPR